MKLILQQFLLYLPELIPLSSQLILSVPSLFGRHDFKQLYWSNNSMAANHFLVILLPVIHTQRRGRRSLNCTQAERKEGTGSLYPPEAQRKQELHPHWSPPDGMGTRGPGPGGLAFLHLCGRGENKSALIYCKEGASSSPLGKPNWEGLEKVPWRSD